MNLRKPQLPSHDWLLSPPRPRSRLHANSSTTSRPLEARTQPTVKRVKIQAVPVATPKHNTLQNSILELLKKQNMNYFLERVQLAQTKKPPGSFLSLPQRTKKSTYHADFVSQIGTPSPICRPMKTPLPSKRNLGTHSQYKSNYIEPAKLNDGLASVRNKSFQAPFIYTSNYRAQHTPVYDRPPDPIPMVDSPETTVKMPARTPTISNYQHNYTEALGQKAPLQRPPPRDPLDGSWPKEKYRRQISLVLPVQEQLIVPLESTVPSVKRLKVDSSYRHQFNIKRETRWKKQIPQWFSKLF